MKRKFCCDASRATYMDYYSAQSGSGMPVFQGSRGQRGHGLGSMLSGLFRSAMPMLQRGLAIFGKQALKTGLEVANDMADGSSFSDSARRRVPTGIKRTIETVANQSGSGKRRVNIKKRKGITRHYKDKLGL